jgi:hypothetical protein
LFLLRLRLPPVLLLPADSHAVQAATDRNPFRQVSIGIQVMEVRGMKRVLILAAAMVLVLFAAGRAGAAYTNYCYVGMGGLYPGGPDYAGVDFGDSYAWARADGWDLGSVVRQNEDATTNFGSSFASSSFEQEFTVVGTGSAIIDLAYQGDLSYYASGVNGGYQVEFDIDVELWQYNTFRLAGAGEVKSGSGDDSGSWHYSSTVSIGDTYTQNDIGDVVTLKVFLVTRSDGPASFVTDGSFTGVADFYGSLSLASYSDNLAPLDAPGQVPAPAALWLLASGLLALAGLRKNSL